MGKTNHKDIEDYLDTEWTYTDYAWYTFTVSIIDIKYNVQEWIDCMS